MKLVRNFGTSTFVALALAGCGQTGAKDTDASQSQTASVPAEAAAPADPNQLSPAEENAIKQGVIQILASHVSSSPLGEDPHRCTQVFDFGPPQILDKSLTGASGKVRVSVAITGARPLYFQYRVPPYSFLDDAKCYGTAPGGWTPGKTSIATYVVNVERWSSGWRISQPQDLQPVS